VLQRGAREVVAVDVGYGQLHERVASDPRVAVVDRTNIRHLDLAAVGGPADLVVADLSFISLRTVAASLVSFAVPGGDLVVLVKPQFEATRSEVDRGRGIIVDPDVWARVLGEVIAAFGDRGATIMGVMASVITGSDGNVEFVLHAVAPGGREATIARSVDDHAAAVGAAVREAMTR
jgi:23S rRNA (cytidine1920-2'-O)/16S rRNA (cytidine1409-2'-O)-methyltransferase